MVEIADRRRTTVATVAFGAALLCAIVALAFVRTRSVAAQEQSGTPPARAPGAQVAPARAPSPAPTPSPARPPSEPSRPNPFLPVLTERQYNIRGFYGPTYTRLPITMTLGFPELIRPVGGPVAPGALPEPESYMRCSAIIWDKSGNVVAVVQVEEAGQLQGYTVHPGDLVSSYIVEEITQNTVTMRDRDTGKRRTVRLESARPAAEGAAAAAPPQPGGGRRPAPGRAPVGLPRPPG